MKYVLTIIADISHNTVSEDHVEVIKKHLESPRNHVWLEQGRAFDIFFEKNTPIEIATIRQQASDILTDVKVDLCIQPEKHRRKNLLIADMDSTIIEQECIDEIADVLGLKEKIAGITERAMRGELEFESALIERVRLLKGIERNQLQKVLETTIKLTPGATTLVRTMNAHGAITALISGGFTFFTNQIADMVGFGHNQANELLFDGNELSGDVAKPILGKDAKRAALINLRQESNISQLETLAVGDGANDLAMIEEASLGVAFHAKPAVAAAADAQINHTDLSSLLFFQGYRQEEFVT